MVLDGGGAVSDPTAALEHVDVVVPRSPMDREHEFAAFMLEATPALARTAWLLCGDEHRAEELVQQALMRTFVAWSTARERDPLAYAGGLVLPSRARARTLAGNRLAYVAPR